MRRLLTLFILLLVSLSAKSQLYINEISQGTSGNKEYIEFVVAGTRTCTDSTMDIRGMIFDDNPGWYGTQAFNTGSMRFANIASWAAVPYGSIILVYNAADKNLAITQTDDPTDANHDYVYIVPTSAAQLEVNLTQPAASSPTYNYSAATTWSAATTSSYTTVMALGNGGDAVHVVNPAVSTTVAVHSVGYGALSLSTNAAIYFSNSGAQINYYNNGSSPALQSSWSTGAAPANETPGAGNTTANTNWINAMHIQAAAPGTPGAISGPASLCGGAMATYSITPVTGATSYIWTLPSGITGSSSTSSINITAGGSGGNITVAASSACGTSAAVSVSVAVSTPATPAVTIAASPAGSICSATSVTFTPTPANGGASPVYNWYKNGALVFTGSSYTASGWANNDAVYAILTSSLTCTTTATATSNTITLSVTSAPATPGSISGPASVCAGSVNTYSISSVTGATSYTWTLPGGYTGSSASASINATAGSTGGSISVTVGNACGTSGAATLPVTVNAVVVPAVSISANPGTTICANTSVTFTALTTNGGATPVYQWTKNGVNTGTGAATYTNSALANGDVIAVTLTSNATCASPASASSNSLTMTVNANLTPAVSIAASPSGAICSSASITFTATPVNGGTAPTYQWTKNGVNVATGNTYTATGWTNGDQIQATMTSNAGCTTSPTAASNIVTLSVTATPATPGAITGNAVVCSGVSQSYSIISVPGATSYTWTLPSGWSGASTTVAITATPSAGGGNITVTASNSCGTSAASTLPVTSGSIPSAPNFISGNTSVCAGSSNAYFVGAVSNAASYSWSVPSGWSITFGNSTTSITATAGSTGGNILVTATSSCGTSPSAPLYPVTVSPVVTPAVTIAANPGTTICSGTSVTFTATPANGGTLPSYQWKKNGLNVGSNNAQYTDNALVTGDQISVMLTSSVTCTSSANATSNTLTMTVNSAPPVPGTITGSTQVCPASVNVYSITALPAATSYSWSLPSGWSGASAVASISATAGTAGGNVSVTATNGCGTSAAAALAVSVTASTTPSVSINASTGTTICSGTAVTFTAVPVNGGTPTYQWRKNSVNIAGANGSTYTTNTLATGDAISVVMTTSLACSTVPTATSSSLTFTANSAPAQPGAITGNTVVCNGSNQAYSINPVSGAVSYTWTLPATWSGSSTANSINTIVGSAGGTIQVVAANTCGTSASQLLTVTVNTAPAQPGAISGPASPCASSSVSYSVSAVAGAVSYAWTLPAGWAGSSTASNISVTTGTGGGNITVTASNLCGTSAAASLAVAPVNVPPAPGAISGNASPCAGTQQTYSVASVSGLTYNWAAPTGWTGSSTGSSITYTTNASSGTVSVTATGACGTSAAATLAVQSGTSASPSVSITTASQNICAGVPVTFTAMALNGGTSPTYQWKKNGVYVGTNAATYTDNTLVTGDVISLLFTSGNACAAIPTATSNNIAMTVNPSVVPGINVNIFPGTTPCAGTTLTFVSNITGGGSNPAYQWYKNGLLIAGATGANYVSSAFTNGDTINAVLISSATCPTVAAMSSNKVGIKVNPVVVPVIAVSSSIAMPMPAGTTVTFTASYSGGGSTPVLQWIKNGADVPNQTGTTFTTSALSYGDAIAVRIISDAPCAMPVAVTSVPYIVTVQSPQGVGTVAGNWNGTLSLYPNPSSGHFTVRADWGAGHTGERVRLDLVNILGQAVYTTEVVPDRAEWSVDVWLNEAVANGQYQLRLRTEHMQAIRPVMIQR